MLGLGGVRDQPQRRRVVARGPLVVGQRPGAVSACGGGAGHGPRRSSRGRPLCQPRVGVAVRDAGAGRPHLPDVRSAVAGCFEQPLQAALELAVVEPDVHGYAAGGASQLVLSRTTSLPGVPCSPGNRSWTVKRVRLCETAVWRTRTAPELPVIRAVALRMRRPPGARKT